MSRTEKTISKTNTRSILIYATPEPKRYSNLKDFCTKNNISYNTYSRKSFPIKYGDYYLYKICLDFGAFDECIFEIVLNQFKNLEDLGSILNQTPHTVNIQNNLIKNIVLKANYDGKKYKIKGVNLKMKKGLDAQKK